MPEWRKNRDRTELYPVMATLIDDAIKSGLWIYHKTTKKWYTPEEFREVANSLYYTNRDKNNGNEFAIMSPISGLNLRLQTLKKVTDEIEIFKKRIDDYYSIEVKKKR